jgi:hypothetical protein
VSTNRRQDRPGEPALELKNLTDADLVDVNRSRLYRLLSLGFGFPRRELQEAQAELWQLADTLYPELELNREERDLLAPEIESLYINVLDLNEKTRELPDHIVNELEFMHFLAHLAVEAGRGQLGGSVGRGQYVHAQKDFLERHLGQWIAKFCEALQEKTDERFYVQLAVLTAQFVKDDLEWVRDQYEAGEG